MGATRVWTSHVHHDGVGHGEGLGGNAWVKVLVLSAWWLPLLCLGCGTSEEPSSPLDAAVDDAEVGDAGPQDGGGGDANGCTPTTCQALGAECGTPDDGCGGTLDCGGCTEPEVCGLGGHELLCGCSPTTCEALGAECGTPDDGCGDALDCGECTEPETCGGGGDALQCGCTPATCEAVGAECGAPDDGCGGMLDCGECTEPAICGLGGEDFKCACHPISGHGPHTATLAASEGGCPCWMNPDHALEQDDDGAHVSLSTQSGQRSSNRLVVSNFGFDVPLDATVTGVEVTVRRRRTAGGDIQPSGRVRLVSDSFGDSDPIDGSTWSGSFQDETFGDPTNLWGVPLIPAIVNAPDFGVAVVARLPFSTFGIRRSAQVDVVRATVHYRLPCE